MIRQSRWRNSTLRAPKALLKEAGWRPAADGICRDAAGDRLSLEFSTTALNRLRELQQQVLQSDLKNACVEVTIKNEPARTLFGQTSNSVSIPAW
jgi:peptide/nickel transport system substrate-binding protein